MTEIVLSLPRLEKNEKVKDMFEKVALAHELLSATGEQDVGESISPSEMYRLAQDKAAPSELLDRVANAPASVRTAYVAMLRRGAMYHMPRPMAASTTRLAPRAGNGGTLRFEYSKAEPDQVYVIIELENQSLASPTRMIVCDAENRFRQIDLPEARDGIIQFIARRSSPIIEMLDDPSTEVYLR